MIAFHHVALRRGRHLLLSDVNLVIKSTWRLGVIGRNGCGKSSFFALLQGQLEPDAGDLHLPGSLRLASVLQETPASSESAMNYVLAGDEDLATALRDEKQAQDQRDMEALARAHQRIDALQGYDAQARVGRLLHGLGFAAETHFCPVKSFSGGWRARLNLARALMAPSDVLLLDEPTNHLDLDAVVWLEEWLRHYQGTLLLISHDREFLDKVIDHTLHLSAGRASLYSGNYSAFERIRAEQLRQQQACVEREHAERAHLQAFINRFKAKASKARQAQSRIKRLEKMTCNEAVRIDHAVHFRFAVPDRVPAAMLQLEDVVAGYQEVTAGELMSTTNVLSKLCVRLEAGDRVGLLGPNGAGKSTLVKTLVGELTPLGGQRKVHKDVQIGYFAQHTVESLRAGTSPLDHLHDKAPTASAQVLRNFLGHWDFTGERIFEPVDGFSGGERARLALALIAWDKPNLLLLDEPTNHLDLEMREALANALVFFEGALVLVSHDRHLLGMVCDHFWRVADGDLTFFNGDLDDYARWLRARSSKMKKSVKLSHNKSVRPSTARKHLRAKANDPLKASRQRLGQIEARLDTIGTELKKIASRLTEPTAWPVTTELMKLSQQEKRLCNEQATLESEWFDLSQQLEL